MATDGVKIIDGDTAHDTYWGMMDLYDSGAEFDVIDKEFPLVQSDYFDDFDNEIYVTACALALWEIGQMTEKKLAYIKSVLSKGACVKEWSSHDEKAGKARQKELDKFWKKISQVKTTPRARKKYRKITNLYFSPDDLLTFQLKDGNYRAVICTSIDQYRGQCNYILVPTTYNSNKKPAVEDMINEEILGRTIGSSCDPQTVREMQPGIDRIWSLSGGDCNFFFGLIMHAVDHKDFIDFKEKFERVGTLKIVDGLKRMGSFGYESSFDRFETIFSDLENHIKIFQQEKYPVKVLCDLQ